MLIYLLIIFSIYFGFLLTCLRGWIIFSSPVGNHSSKNNEFASIVVAVRNEEYSINPLLDSLLLQDYPRDRFEIIIVDDHSTDNTKRVIQDWLKDNPSMLGHLLHSTGNGKKRALTEGVKHAKGDIILTTDADCVLPVDWVLRMVNSFTSSTTMVIGLVKIQASKSLFTKLQALEFTSLMASTMALHALDYPVMCNGASLAFRRSSFAAVNGYEDNVHIPSGDDEFLMRKLNKVFPGSIKSVRWPSMVVTTEPQPTLKNFIYQRLRWAGKWKSNGSITAKVLALFIFIFQVTNILGMYLLITHDFRFTVALLLSVKLILEAIYLMTVSRYVRQPFSIPAFFVLQVVYPYYVLIIGILSQLLDYEWKGRRQSSLG